jgi:hypothetical protein
MLGKQSVAFESLIYCSLKADLPSWLKIISGREDSWWSACALMQYSQLKQMASRGCWISQNRYLWARRLWNLPDTRKCLAPICGNVALIRLHIPLASTFSFLLTVLAICILSPPLKWNCFSLDFFWVPVLVHLFAEHPSWPLHHPGLPNSSCLYSFLRPLRAPFPLLMT